MNIHEHMNERSEKNTHLLRVWVLGPLAIEWAEGTFPPERMCGRGSARALGLLKALLSQADRFATRDWLMEQFWPDSAISSAQERLDDVASGLRTLLRPPGSSANFLHYVHGSDGKGSGYRLEGYPRLWVDADAFGWLVEQACRLDRFGQDSLPLWEQAYQLGARGSFLPEERYSDWAQARRELLAGGYRQCVHRLAALLRARGANEQALLRLRTYWQAHSTDEDILRPLMELLGEQERYQEVEESYEKGREALLQEGKEPDSRTQDLREYLRTKQIQRQRRVETPTTIEGAQLATGEKRRDPRDVLTLTTKQAELISSFLGEGDSHNGSFDPSRRLAILQLVALLSTAALPWFDPEPWQRLQVAPTQPSAMNGKAFMSFQHIITDCWSLCNSGEMEATEQLLTPIVERMKYLVPHHQEASLLAAEGLRLQSVLSAHQLNLAQKMDQCLQSVHYARLSGDLNTLAAALHELAAAFRYTHQYDAMFTVFQEALSFSEHVSPLLRSGIYAGAAAAFASKQRIREALFYKDLAYETFPDHPEDDIAALSADNTLCHLAEYEGILYLDLKQPEKAKTVLERFTHQSSENLLPERNRLEMLNYQGRAVLQLGNLEEYAFCLEQGLSGARALQSKKRWDEVLTPFRQEMPECWLREPPIQRVIEHFQLARRV